MALHGYRQYVQYVLRPQGVLWNYLLAAAPPFRLLSTTSVRRASGHTQSVCSLPPTLVMSALSASGGSKPVLHFGTRSTMGAQVKSQSLSAPSYGFGTSSRETAQKRFISNAHAATKIPGYTPGPGAYEHQVTVSKKQSESRSKQAPSWRFGSESRFDSRAAKRDAAVPGPGAYVV